MAVARGDGYATGFFLGWTLCAGAAMALLIGAAWWIGAFRERRGNVAIGVLGLAGAAVSILSLPGLLEDSKNDPVSNSRHVADSAAAVERSVSEGPKPPAPRAVVEPRDKDSVFGGLDEEIGVDDDAVRKAARQYTSEADAIWARINDAMARLREPNFLDPNYLSTREIVSERRAVVAEYKRAVARMRDHLTRREAVMSQLMTTHGVSAGKQKEVAEGLNRMDPIFRALIDYLDAEVMIGETVESMFTTLEQNWTSWGTDPRTGDIYFANRGALQRYNNLVMSLRSRIARADTMRERAIAALP